MKNILVADIGGTNTKFAVFDNKFKLLFKEKHYTKYIKNLKNPIDYILNKYSITEACFAVAAPINKNKVKLTNANLIIDINKLKKSTKLKKIILLNDFEALGYGISLLKKNQIYKLNNKKYKKSNIAIIGAGTGLGMSIITNKKVVTSEGGHSSFIIQDELDIEFYEYLRKKFKKNPDLEKQLSGPGILNIYNFLQYKKFKQNKNIKKEISMVKNEEKPHLITTYSNKDPLCKKVIELFVKYYAKAAQNLVLTSNASSLYIAGGIAPNILNNLKKYFMKEFIKHQLSNYSRLLKEVPVFVILDYNATLYGAANYILNFKSR